MNRAYIRDLQLHLLVGRWSLMGVFRCLPGSDGTQTERRAVPVQGDVGLVYRSRDCQATKASSRLHQVMARAGLAIWSPCLQPQCLWLELRSDTRPGTGGLLHASCQVILRRVQRDENFGGVLSLRPHVAAAVAAAGNRSC